MIANEVGLRYLSAKEIKKAPPRSYSIGDYRSSADVMKRLTEFANWFARHFIGPSWPLLQEAFQTGLETFGLYDFCSLAVTKKEVVSAMKEKRQRRQRAAGFLRLLANYIAVGYGHDDREALLSLTTTAFGKRVPIAKGEESGQSGGGGTRRFPC